MTSSTANLVRVARKGQWGLTYLFVFSNAVGVPGSRQCVNPPLAFVSTVMPFGIHVGSLNPMDQITPHPLTLRSDREPVRHLLRGGYVSAQETHIAELELERKIGMTHPGAEVLEIWHTCPSAFI